MASELEAYPVAKSNSEIGQEIQQKLNFYLIALVFTVLGLSFQTANFGTSLLADTLELLAWFSLLVSGFAGLKHLEIMPKLYQLFEISDQDNETVKDATDEVNKRVERWYSIHKYTLLAGFALLLFARAYLPAKGIAESIIQRIPSITADQMARGKRNEIAHSTQAVPAVHSHPRGLAGGQPRPN